MMFWPHSVPALYILCVVNCDFILANCSQTIRGRFIGFSLIAKLRLHTDAILIYVQKVLAFLTLESI